jgi:preprotein translocase subunit YajC
MKTVKDYRNDSRLKNDPLTKGAPEPIKDLRATRLKIQDEMEGLNLEERVKYINLKGQEVIEKAGLTGKIKFVDKAECGKIVYKKQTSNLIGKERPKPANVKEVL